MSEQITGNICYYNACCGILYANPFFHADKQDHCHGENGQKQLIIDSREPAGKCHCCMQQSEKMDNPSYIYILQFTHIRNSSSEVSKFAKKLQSLLTIRHRNPAIHLLVLTIRRVPFLV